MKSNDVLDINSVKSNESVDRYEVIDDVLDINWYLRD